MSVILILVIDPAETLKKSRDAQRISDLNTLKTAIGVYGAGTSTVFLTGASTNIGCKNGSGVGSYASGISKVWYSTATDTAHITDIGVDGGAASSSQVLSASLSNTVADNKLIKDGGNNTSMYEIGANLQLLGTSSDF